MAETKPGFMAQVKSYPAAFWVANTMEIFERMAWYGWFTVMALYVSGTVATGGLGFSTELTGTIQGIVPFFLYLLPVLTGALADRYGYKKMFIISYLVMIVAYYLLGQFHTVPTFFMAFMFVAVGAAIFKPVVVGTVARATDESNSAIGFGIFYMMVNVGGFAGPIIAGLVRGRGWENVFIACSAWAALNLVIVLIFYKEPKVAQTPESQRSLRKVGDNMVEVLGNLRFFVIVFVVLFALMFANLDIWLFARFSWTNCAIFIPVWIALNFVWDALLPAGSGNPKNPASQGRAFLFKRMHCSNWRFALFLLIMSGFWTAFNQIFLTMPEYIRDFVDTRPLIKTAQAVESTAVYEWIFGESDPNDAEKGLASLMATINPDERHEIVLQVEKLTRASADGSLNQQALETASRELLQSKLRLTSGELKEHLRIEALDLPERSQVAATMRELKSIMPDNVRDREQVMAAIGESFEAASGRLREDDLSLRPGQMARLLLKEELSAEELTSAAIARIEANPVVDRMIIAGRQMNPEYIVNINAGAIVLFQVLISFFMGRFHRFTTMIVGMLIAAVGIGLSTFSGTEGTIGQGGLIWIVAGGIFVFSFGEMMASPTSQEYVGRIAPAEKKALYMGYYFVAVALGNLFAGILKGEMMSKLAYEMNRPDLMWAGYGAIMFATAVVFMLYNRFALPKGTVQKLT